MFCVLLLQRSRLSLPPSYVKMWLLLRLLWSSSNQTRADGCEEWVRNQEHCSPHLQGGRRTCLYQRAVEMWTSLNCGRAWREKERHTLADAVLRSGKDRAHDGSDELAQVEEYLKLDSFFLRRDLDIARIRKSRSVVESSLRHTNVDRSTTRVVTDICSHLGRRLSPLFPVFFLGGSGCERGPRDPLREKGGRVRTWPEGQRPARHPRPGRRRSCSPGRQPTTIQNGDRRTATRKDVLRQYRGQSFEHGTPRDEVERPDAVDRQHRRSIVKIGQHPHDIDPLSTCPRGHGKLSTDTDGCEAVVQATNRLTGDDASHPPGTVRGCHMANSQSVETCAGDGGTNEIQAHPTESGHVVR